MAGRKRKDHVYQLHKMKRALEHAIDELSKLFPHVPKPHIDHAGEIHDFIRAVQEEKKCQITVSEK